MSLLKNGTGDLKMIARSIRCVYLDKNDLNKDGILLTDSINEFNLADLVLFDNGYEPIVLKNRFGRTGGSSSTRDSLSPRKISRLKKSLNCI